eukprot:3174929-Rhodomonas_salina.1
MNVEPSGSDDASSSMSHGTSWSPRSITMSPTAMSSDAAATNRPSRATAYCRRFASRSMR